MGMLTPTHSKRFAFFLVGDIILLTFSFYLSFLFFYNFKIPVDIKENFTLLIGYFIPFKILFILLFRGYRIIWRYFSIKDAINIFLGIFVSNIIFLPVSYFLLKFSLPISIFFIDIFVSLFFILSFRILKRVFLELIFKTGIKRGKRTFIIGAGNIGELILRDIVKNRFLEYYPIGFVDDDIKKIGGYIHSLKVFGPIEKIPNLVYKYDIECCIIAIHNIKSEKLREIYRMLKEAGVKSIKIIPEIYGSFPEKITIKKLEEIKIEDLVGRKEVKLNLDSIKNFIYGKKVLITGAGGSIGSELAFQVLQFEPSYLILLDIDETEIFNLEKKFKNNFTNNTKVEFIVADIKDYEKINEIFERFNPDIVFHSAAYKHVPLMELHPDEAVKVNIFGTYNLAKISVSNRVKKFVLISTDKAINPTSVMGATKRMSEYICNAWNELGITEFVSVRFGNVIGSRGSVIPLFLEQLKNGGPLTVTHKEMKRYFMTIPESVSLVLQASVLGEGGQVLVLDMGEPVSILKLAEDLIRLHGLEPYKDIDIDFIGLRPGEKIFEELLTSEEGTTATKHERIFIAKNKKRYSLDEIDKIIEELKEVVWNVKDDKGKRIKEILAKYIVTYKIG